MVVVQAYEAELQHLEADLSEMRTSCSVSTWCVFMNFDAADEANQKEVGGVRKIGPCKRKVCECGGSKIDSYRTDSEHLTPYRHDKGMQYHIIIIDDITRKINS